MLATLQGMASLKLTGNQYVISLNRSAALSAETGQVA
jgi:hypothetical protein